MPSLIDMRRRIRAVKSTQQITKAMKMVAASKLRRAQERVIATRPFAIEARHVLASIASRVDEHAHPLLVRRAGVETGATLLIVITSDRGPAHKRALMEAGADDWLAEPLDPELLRLRLRLAERRLADIAEQGKSEQALRESEERYRSVFEGVPIGLYRTTPAGRLLDANDALVRVLGYPDRETLLRANVGDIYFDPEDRHRWQRAVEEEGGSRIRSFETRVREVFASARL
jgi:PAS domain-containing protein